LTLYRDWLQGGAVDNDKNFLYFNQQAEELRSGWTLFYTVFQKTPPLILPVTSANVDRFSKSCHHQTRHWLRNAL